MGHSLPLQTRALLSTWGNPTTLIQIGPPYLSSQIEVLKYGLGEKDGDRASKQMTRAQRHIDGISVGQRTGTLLASGI